MRYSQITIAYRLIGQQFDKCLKRRNSLRRLRFFQIRKPQILMSDSVLNDFRVVRVVRLLRDSGPNGSQPEQQCSPDDAS